jgi:hypothetical protein
MERISNNRDGDSVCALAALLSLIPRINQTNDIFHAPNPTCRSYGNKVDPDYKVRPRRAAHAGVHIFSPTERDILGKLKPKRISLRLTGQAYQ